MNAFLDVVDVCWDLVGGGIEFLFDHPYVLIGTGLGVVSSIIAIGKKAVRVKK